MMKIKLKRNRKSTLKNLKRNRKNTLKKSKRNRKSTLKKSKRSRKSTLKRRPKKYNNDGVVDEFKSGIVLNDKIISGISGPVSLIILKPTIEFYKEYQAPIFILFGDVHDSDDNICEECVCNDSNCCYNIYSETFLQLLDNIGSDPKFPVDFNIESSINIHTKKSLKEKDKDMLLKLRIEAEKLGYPLDILRDKFYSCYSKITKEENFEFYKKYCPTENIRWQLADSRFSYYDEFLTNEEGTEYMTYKYDFGYFMDQMYILIKYLARKKIEEKKIKLLITNLYKFRRYFNTFKFILSENFFEHIKSNEDNFVIFKQIRKMEEYKAKQWEIWFNDYYKYFYNKYVESHDKELKEELEAEDAMEYFISLSKLEKTLVDLIEYLPKFYKKECTLLDIINFCKPLREDFSYLTSIIENLNTPLLDLYYLSRTFKPPKGSAIPLISIAYFGVNHINNIAYFLQNIMGHYEKVYIKNKKHTDNGDRFVRCLTIDEHVDLQSIIDSYKM